MDELNSQFSIAKNDLEIRFTYFYFLGYSLRVNGQIKGGAACSAFVQRDGWENGEEAGYFSNSFIEKMELSHFHLDPEILFKGKTCFEVKASEENSTSSYKFKFYDKPDLIESIGAVECSILKSGYLALTIRIVNASDIPSLEAIKLINNLELINRDVSDPSHAPGNLVIKVQEFIPNIESYFPELLNGKNVTRYDLNTDEHVPLPDLEYDDKRRSRPYIGILFKFKGIEHHKLDHLKTSIQRFVIASARTTPEFLTSFSKPDEYLSRNSRNIYDPGKSIVYIARRAWCVFDAGDHDRHTFRVGVLETTHFVIISILAAARSWRKYIEDTETEAGKRFEELNKETKMLVKSKSNKAYQEALGQATQLMALTNLVSPTIGFSRLIESHTKSHTARSAVRRCEDISNIKELESISQAKISGYSNSLRMASNYYQAQASDYRKKGIKIAIWALVINVVVSIVVNLDKILGVIKSWLL